jgi:hypothetical protein
MPRSYPVNFRIHIPEPVEVKMVSPTLAVRDAISPLERFKGLFTYVVEEDEFYYLSKGTTNNHWKLFGKSEIAAIEILDLFSDQPQTVISGFGLKAYLEENYVGKTEFNQAVASLQVADHVKAISQEQIQRWEASQGDKHLIHQQTSPSVSWLVNHGLGKKPAVQSFLPNNMKIEGKIEHLDNDMLTISFSKPLTGYVTAN